MTQPNQNVTADEVLTRLRNSLKQIKVQEDHGEETYYRVEGDMLLDDDQLEIYARQRALIENEKALRSERAALGAGDIAPPEGRSSLVGITVNGKLVRWAPGVKLTYCVLKNTFGSDDKYETVKNNIKLAIWDWESICGVKFEHVESLDTSGTTKPAGVLFTVREIDAGGEFIASAFFPNDPKNRRRVLIDPSYYTTTFDQVGVLRHELGHVIGFRHEHIRSDAPPQCPDETTFDTVNLTKYDPQSVMHYFCGQVGTRELKITDVDKEGAQKLYGPPATAFTFIE